MAISPASTESWPSNSDTKGFVLFCFFPFPYYCLNLNLSRSGMHELKSHVDRQVFLNEQACFSQTACKFFTERGTRLCCGLRKLKLLKWIMMWLTLWALAASVELSLYFPTLVLEFPIFSFHLVWRVKKKNKTEIICVGSREKGSFGS